MKELTVKYSKMNKLIIELKNDSMKDKHWRMILSKIGVNEAP